LNEQLIEQVRLDPAVAGQQMSREQLAEGRLVMKDADHLGLAHSHGLAFDHRLGRRQTQRLADQATLAEEFTWTKEGDDGFLALLGLDHELDLAFLDVKDRSGRVALSEDDSILGVPGGRAAVIHSGEKYLRIEGGWSFRSHDCHPRP